MGKGSTRRPTNEEEYSKNWTAIFGEKKEHRCNLFVMDDARNQKVCYHCRQPAEDEVPF